MWWDNKEYGEKLQTFKYFSNSNVSCGTTSASLELPVAIVSQWAGQLTSMGTLPLPMVELMVTATTAATEPVITAVTEIVFRTWSTEDPVAAPAITATSPWLTRSCGLDSSSAEPCHRKVRCIHTSFTLSSMIYFLYSVILSSPPWVKNRRIRGKWRDT